MKIRTRRKIKSKWKRWIRNGCTDATEL